jgi:hypothetical protein
MTDHDKRLRALCDRVLEVFERHTRPDAALLAGSVATGGADELSDLDLLLYYAELPPDEAIAAARAELGGDNLKLIAPRSEAGVIEQFDVDGVPCQVGHIAFADVEGDLRRLTVDLDPDPFVLKMVGGLHDGVVLRGGDVIERWRAEARFSDELQRALVARHWKIFPLLRLHDHVAARDAELWRRQILVDASFDLLSVLAAANRVWFSTFQPKRLRRLVDRFDEAPDDLAGRLESLHALEPLAAAEQLERLRAETEAILSARGLLP